MCDADKTPLSEDFLGCLRAVLANTPLYEIASVKKNEIDNVVNPNSTIEIFPTILLCKGPFDAKESLINAGIVFLEVIDEERLFQNVCLPEGWKKQSTDDPSVSLLLDLHQRVRAKFIHNQAIFGKSVHLDVVTRFNFRGDSALFNNNIAITHVLDCEKTIFTTTPIKFDNDIERYKCAEESLAQAVKWLVQKYPDWKNPSKYWDE